MSTIVRDRIRDSVLEDIYKALGSSEFMVVINGVPKRYNKSFVYARAKRTRESNFEVSVEFFIKYRTEGKSFQHIPTNLEDSVMEDAMSGELFGYDFSKWLERYWESTGNSRVFVAVNNTLNILILESPIYNIFKTAIPPRQNLNVTFSPELNDGRTLNIGELTRLLSRFRINGFRTMLELEKAGIGRRILSTQPKLYRIGDSFSLGLVRINNLYNPLMDDMMLHTQIRESVFMKTILRRQLVMEKSGMTSVMLSNEHICRSLGIENLVPFNFEILTSMVAGLVLPAGDLPIDIPNKNKRVMRLSAVTEDDLPYVMSPEEYLESSDYVKAQYTVSTSLRTFILQKSSFFLGRGFRDINRIIDILEEAALV